MSEKLCVLCGKGVGFRRWRYCSQECLYQAGLARVRLWGSHSREWRRAYRAARPEKHREYSAAWRLKKFGASLEWYEERLKAQGGKCAICGAGHDPSRKLSLRADHDHDKTAPRGLVCAKCNSGLGMFGDNPDRLIAAVLYLLSAGGVANKVGSKWEVGLSA